MFIYANAKETVPALFLDNLRLEIMHVSIMCEARPSARWKMGKSVSICIKCFVTSLLKISIRFSHAMSGQKMSKRLNHPSLLGVRKTHSGMNILKILNARLSQHQRIGALMMLSRGAIITVAVILRTFNCHRDTISALRASFQQT